MCWCVSRCYVMHGEWQVGSLDPNQTEGETEQLALDGSMPSCFAFSSEYYLEIGFGPLDFTQLLVVCFIFIGECFNLIRIERSLVVSQERWKRLFTPHITHVSHIMHISSLFTWLHHHHAFTADMPPCLFTLYQSFFFFKTPHNPSFIIWPHSYLCGLTS